MSSNTLPEKSDERITEGASSPATRAGDSGLGLILSSFVSGAVLLLDMSH